MSKISGNTRVTRRSSRVTVISKEAVIDYLEKIKEPHERNYRETMDYYSGRDADWRIMRVLTDAIEIIKNA